MKRINEALLEIPAFNDRPELAKAKALAFDLSQICKRTMETQNYHEKGIKDGLEMASKEYDRALEICESPIECLMLAALQYSHWGIQFKIPARVIPPKFLPPDCGICIYPQFQFAHYRLDFLVVGRTREGEAKFIDVECDGHEFHENVSQRKWNEDRMRDAFMSRFGVEVFRFTGSEIWANAEQCAADVALSMGRWSVNNG